jgi:hypothetical protein
MNEQEWVERCTKLGSIPIDIQINLESGKMYLECYQNKSDEFDASELSKELKKFRNFLYEEAIND